MYYIISNPTAGRRGNKHCLRLATKIFDENGAEYKIYETNFPKEAKAIAEKLTGEGATNLVVVGGDGTLHEVLNGIVNPTECKVGLIPAGTGNDFADAMKLPRDPETATKLILKGETKPTDYLEIDGVRCMNVGGMGIDVDILKGCQRGKLKGKAKYFISLLRTMFKFKGMDVSYEKNGEVINEKVLIAAVCNGSQFGGGLKVCPNAVIDDNKLEVVIVRHVKGVFKLIHALLQVLKGKITSYHLTDHFYAESLKVSAQPCTIQLDGELYDGLNFDAKIHSGLRFYR
ncbi:MAG: YegS/Rv2252/BmrU family lipid kinase [Clostridia bacterium]|nr:YegS/Rv2252/BmrU family lipid kinase [Clostridia bacterium]